MTNGCNESGAEPKKVPIAEAARVLQAWIEGADALRAAQLGGIHTLRQVKGANLTREQTRLGQALGEGHPQLAIFSEKITANQMLATQLERVTAVAKASVPQVDADTWIVHGHVRTKELKAVPQVTVALYTRDGQWLRQFGHDCTDANGHFKLCIKRDAGKSVEETTPDHPIVDRRLSGQAAANVAQPEIASMRTADTLVTAAARAVFLRVTDGKQMLLGVDPVPLTPRLGQVDYREIILDGRTCASPPDKTDPDCGPAPDTKPDEIRKTRFLGNSNNRELHDLKKAKKGCQIDEIAADHRVFFQTADEAVKAGYDYCAYCFGKAKSKR